MRRTGRFTSLPFCPPPESPTHSVFQLPALARTHARHRRCPVATPPQPTLGPAAFEPEVAPTQAGAAAAAGG
jgi:hypothetical protein